MATLGLARELIFYTGGDIEEQFNSVVKWIGSKTEQVRLNNLLPQAM